MKTILVTMPIRPFPTTYLPFVCLVLLNYLRKHGIEANRQVSINETWSAIRFRGGAA